MLQDKGDTDQGPQLVLQTFISTGVSKKKISTPHECDLQWSLKCPSRGRRCRHPLIYLLSSLWRRCTFNQVFKPTKLKARNFFLTLHRPLTSVCSSMLCVIRYCNNVIRKKIIIIVIPKIYKTSFHWLKK